jgi:hypothetical protein
MSNVEASEWRCIAEESCDHVFAVGQEQRWSSSAHDGDAGKSKWGLRLATTPDGETAQQNCST